MTAQNLEHCCIATTSNMMFDELFDEATTCTKKGTSHLVSSPPDDHQVAASAPPTAPVSTCASGGSCSSDAAPVTGRLDDIERKYHIEPQVIGTGHHGSVRQCVNRSTSRRYAVKTVRKSDPDVKLGGLAREISLLRGMRNDGIIRLVDVYEDSRHVHLVMELCAGGELFDRIVEKASSDNNGGVCFAEDEAARILHQILTSVSYLHKLGIVHRDIKPENIMFETADANSPIKIIDFGLARVHSKAEPPMRSIVGTPYYIAPEVLRRQYDRSCDLWSVGVIAYVLLCGYPPFNGKNGKEVHRNVLRGKYFFPSEEWKGVSAEAKDFIRRLICVDPKRRMTAKQALRHPWIARHVNGHQ